MSVVTELMYNTLSVIKEECSEHTECADCPFVRYATPDKCMIAPPAEEWDLDSIINTVYANNKFRGR